MKSSLFALLSAAAVFSGADAAGLRSLISSRSRHSVKYPCNPNPHGNALVCKDGSRAFEACSRGHGQAKFYCKRDWNVCGKKDPHTKTWEHRQYCPVGRFQCENGFCSEDAAGCKHFPVNEHAPVCADGKTFSNRCEAEKAGYLGGCSSKIAEGVCARNCGDDEHSITDLACRAGKTVAEFCFENFPSQHVCDNSDLLEAFDSASKLTCSAPECAAHKGYICPANSAPAELYAHPRSFDDCSCDSGFAKHGDMCAVDYKALAERLQEENLSLEKLVAEAYTKLAASVPRSLLQKCSDDFDAYRAKPCGIDIPDIPGIEIPDIPGIEIPDIPGIEIPGIEIPDIPGIEIPGIEIPDIPGIEIPGF